MGCVPVDMEMKGGQVLRFNVAAQEKCDAFFALGIRKSGSSLFSNLTSALARHNEVNVIDIAGTMFAGRYRYPDWNEHQRIADVIWRGNAYVGFRDAPTGIYADPVFRDAHKILMVRDPRDALVSEYFSNAYSHSVPAQVENGKPSIIEEERAKALQSGIADYALKRVVHLDRTVGAFAPLLGHSKLLVIRYEDVVFDKAAWLHRIANHFDWRINDELVKNILSWADVRPAAENPTAFVRHVAPGDHLNKLDRCTIERINKSLSRVWTEFGYEVEN